MPTISPKELKLMERLSKEYRIVFPGYLKPEEWPECHRGKLEAVAALGSKQYSSYAVEPGATDDAPWKAGVKDQADTLVEAAKRARHRNESTWRFSCEPLVLSRLSAEVVCQSCRNRVWRSEIEARFDDDRSRRGTSLRERQHAREPCRCPQIARGKDKFEAVGLNRIFGHREDEVVRHEPAIAKRLDKRFQKPDAIFGLRRTRNIENLLHDVPKRQMQQSSDTEPQQQLHEILQPSPVDQSGDELLYPFLVLEAKSGMSDCDWHSIQMQTAFPIRTFLETQNRLRTEAGSQGEPRSAPLVWFFGNRGEDWRVSVAYMVKGKPRAGTFGDRDYIVMDVWSGSIVNPDGALQLLLLVDYVFDWARDVYRENFLGNLRLLVYGDRDAASATHSDTAILSTRQVEPPHIFSSAAGNEDYQAYISARSAFVALDSSVCIVRHATFMESRYCCVFATRDNVHTMLQSINPRKRQKLCRLILDQMQDAMGLGESDINAMEERWTGTARMSSAAALTPNVRFCTIVSCTNYLTASWHQVRELYVVAIAYNAWDAIVEASGLKPDRGNARRPTISQADVNELLTNVNRLRAGTPGDSLLACISRRAVTLHLFTDSQELEHAESPGPWAELQRQLQGKIFPVLSNGVLRDTVHYIYTSLKKGSIDPQESFLRLSTGFSQQHLIPQEQEAVFPRTTHPRWLYPSEDGCVLVHSECHTNDPERSPSTICLYLVDGDPVTPTVEEIALLTKRTFETRDVYHTTQDNGTSNPSTLSTGRNRRTMKSASPTPWNLQDTYGIYSEVDGLVRLVLRRCAGPALPDHQGSPRVSDGAMSGGYLRARTLIPWSDPRRIGQVPEMQMFFLYKLISREIRYWKHIATVRKAEGLQVCQWCAKIYEEGDDSGFVCHECLVDAADSEFDWVGKCLRGEAPFSTDSDDSEEEEADVFSDFEGLPPLNERWKEAIGVYPELERPFEDIGELLTQYRAFKEWADKRMFERIEDDVDRSMKRRRLADGSGIPASAGKSSGSVMPDATLGASRTDVDLDMEQL